MTTVLLEVAEPTMIGEGFEIPPGIRTLADFRKWAMSDCFPQRGRIDYIQGCIEVDMSPENLFFHGALKVEILSVLRNRVRELDMGHLFCDSTRVSHESAQLSAEPDIVFVTHETVAKDGVRLVPGAAGEDGSFVELAGGPDLIVEVVSASSVHKDQVRLRHAYYQAGVQEYWVVDARGQELEFEINTRGESKFEPVPQSADGFVDSKVMSCRYRIHRERHTMGHWTYQLIEDNG